MGGDALKPVRFYFDFISPFGYFASLRIDELAARYGRQVEWTSMLLGISVLKVMKIPPVVELPLKGTYVIRDASRYARQYAVPFRRAASLPVSRTVEAGRLFAWAKALDPERAKHLAGQIFRSYFVECDDIGNLAVLRHCARAAGFEWAEYQAAREQGTPAQLLRQNVDDSLANGVFGSPFFIVDQEPFFGVEKLPVVEQWLAAGGW
ncbi:MAG TPA: DsbA family protein [Ramlibacter sp.]|nr:DsbA family protein [Ramlibacter sp.]